VQWFTFVAQIVNFLVLVFLLKYFLYGRITKAMEARKNSIRSDLESAQHNRQEAEQQAAEYRRKTDELEEQREAWLDDARKQAEKHRAELVQRSREEVSDLRERWRRTVADEKDQFLLLLREKAARQIGTIARRALRDLADAQLEDVLLTAFLSKLRAMDEKELRALGTPTDGTGRSMTLFTSFEVPEIRRSAVLEVVRGVYPDLQHLEFTRDPELICGVELRVDGHAVGWNVDAYLDSLEQEFDEMLSQETAAPSLANPQAADDATGAASTEKD